MSYDEYGLNSHSSDRNSNRSTSKNRRHVAKSQNKLSMDSAPGHVWIWRILKPLLTVLISVVIVCTVLYIVYTNLYSRYFSPVDSESTQEIEITIPSGYSLTKISELLESEGIVRNAKIFKYYVDFSDMSSKIKAGTFILSPSMSFDDIIDVIKRPNEMSAEVWAQLREGLTIEQIADVLIDSGVDIDKNRFLELCKSGSDFTEHEELGDILSDDLNEERTYVLEGYLFPDKYRFFTDASEETVINKLLSQYEIVVTDKYKERADELEMSMDEIIILASMIEKEAKTSDFSGVSAVFHNRLNQDWTLGSDATIKYITGSDDITLSSEELNSISPYNTYKYKGLPPGPICNPGKSAIEAALYPDEKILNEGYMFFCLGDPESGETVFTKTQDEHNKAVEKYSALWEEYNNKVNSETNNNE